LRSEQLAHLNCAKEHTTTTSCTINMISLSMANIQSLQHIFKYRHPLPVARTVIPSGLRWFYDS